MLSVDRLLLETAHKLRDAVRKNESFDTAQIQVIGLSDIRRAAGGDWPTIAERIRRKTMIFLESRLQPGDIIVPCGDGFLIIYAERAAERDISLECTALQDRLNDYYLGEEGLALSAQVRGRVVAAMDVEDMLTPPPRNTTEPIGDVGVKFVPAWCAARETVGMYLATPSVGDPKGPRLSYDPSYRATGQHHRNDYLDVDLTILQASVAAATQCQREGKASAIVYSVHATTMQNRRRRETFLRALAEAPAPIRARLLGRIAEVAHGTPVVSLHDWVSMLHLFTPRVALELHYEERVLCCFNTVRAWSIGCVLPSNIQTPNRRDANLALIDRWARQAHRQGICAGIFNIVDPVLVTAACAFRIDYLGHEGLWPAANTPGDALLFPRTELREAIAAQTRPQELAALA
jgi:hypothetical protein